MIKNNPDGGRGNSLPPLELYLHIPFCIRKCNYCDFLSAPAELSVQVRYMKALGAELAGRSAEAADHEVRSVFLGGGTPSVVPAEEIRYLLDLIREHYHVSADAEISMEVNPGTVDKEKLAVYRSAGINRLSIGLQSAVEEELRVLGRIHTFSQFLETYEAAREAGFTNVNVDLMSALPGQTLASYQRTLETVLALRPLPEHLSAYSLIVEEGTPFARLQEQGCLALPDEDEDRLMYERTGELLARAGYHRYEISNYALPGYECRHNTGYWIRVEYLGFGIGAASLWQETRFSNAPSLEAYLKSPLDVRTPPEVLTTQAQMEETLFLGLRLSRGITNTDFQRRFHHSLPEIYAPVIAQNVRDALLDWDGEHLRLTLRGIDLSNYVLAQFLLSPAASSSGQ